MISRTVLVLTMITITFAKLGDYPILCNFPEFFSTTLTPAETFVDLDKYSGTWYEVARAPFLGERNCICSEANYQWNQEDNKFIIQNDCLMKDGNTSSVTLKSFSKNKYNTFLKAGYILPFLGGNYFIIDIDPQYQWVVVGEPCRKNFWILSRNKSLDKNFIMNKFRALKLLGFPQEIVLREDTCTKNGKQL